MVYFDLGILLFIHFLADFVFQSREIATKKSIEFKWLLIHVWTIFVVFEIAGLFLSRLRTEKGIPVAADLDVRRLEQLLLDEVDPESPT